MTNSTPTQPTSRPYPPPSAVSALLQRIRSRNLPDRIDSEYLRDASIPDSLNARTLSALRFLAVVDDDSPTVALRSIAISTDEEYQAILAGLIRAAYQDVFAVIDPAQDPQNRIINFFRRYTPASQRERMVTFFLGMCREAGIPTMDAPRNRASSVSSGVKTPKAQVKESNPKTVRVSSRDTEKRQNPPPAKVQHSSVSDIPLPLELLIRSLPPSGKPMPQDKQKQWLDMARATLAYVYVDREETLSEDNYPDNDDQEE